MKIQTSLTEDLQKLATELELTQPVTITAGNSSTSLVQLFKAVLAEHGTPTLPAHAQVLEWDPGAPSQVKVFSTPKPNKALVAEVTLDEKKQQMLLSGLYDQAFRAKVLKRLAPIKRSVKRSVEDEVRAELNALLPRFASE